MNLATMTLATADSALLQATSVVLDIERTIVTAEADEAVTTLPVMNGPRALPVILDTVRISR